MQYLLYIPVIYALFLFITYLFTFLQILKLKIQYPQYRVQSGDKVPLYLQKLYQTPIKELEAFDFQPCCYLQVKPMEKLYLDDENWEVLLYSKNFRTYIKLGLRSSFDPLNLFDIEFYTFFTDKTLLLTVNAKAHGFIDETPFLIVQDAYTHQTSVQWQFHQQKIKQLSEHLPGNKIPCDLTPEAFAKALQIHTKYHIDCIAKNKKIKHIKDIELFIFNLSPALNFTFKLVRGIKKSSSLVRKHQQQGTNYTNNNKNNFHTPIDIPIELEINVFKRIEEQRQGLVGNKVRSWLLLGSFLLFIASFKAVFSPIQLVVFVVAILLHEGGHLLAMKLSGHQEASMLFLPFLGAVATARQKDDTTLFQQFWISFAGPFPGLIMGVAVAIACSTLKLPLWINQASWIFIILNLLNLLPIYPLDGGHIVNLLFFSRFPFANVIFKTFCAIVIGIFAINGSQELFLFAFLIVYNIPHDLKTARVSKKLQKVVKLNPPENKEQLINLIIQNLKESGYSNLPANSKYTIIKNLMKLHYQSGGKLTTRLCLIMFYFLSLFGGFAGSLYAVIPRWEQWQLLSTNFFHSGTPEQRRERILQIQKQELENISNTLHLNPNDINSYVKRARLRSLFREHQGALADYNQVIKLQPNNIQYRLSRAHVLSYNLHNYKAALQDYEYIVKLNPKDTNFYHLAAQMRVNLQDYHGAIKDYTTIIKFNSKDSWAYIYRGNARMQLKDYKGALADANYAILLEPKGHDSYRLRASVRRYLGDNQGANADEKIALQLEEEWENNRQD
jgi:tetratricopeptide (TPR) repeat protein